MSTTETKNEIGTFSKILVAIDGSKQSMDAAYYAIIVTTSSMLHSIQYMLQMTHYIWKCTHLEYMT
jgi:hypothetical protein